MLFNIKDCANSNARILHCLWDISFHFTNILWQNISFHLGSTFKTVFFFYNIRNHSKKDKIILLIQEGCLQPLSPIDIILCSQHLNINLLILKVLNIWFHFSPFDHFFSSLDLVTSFPFLLEVLCGLMHIIYLTLESYYVELSVESVFYIRANETFS